MCRALALLDDSSHRVALRRRHARNFGAEVASGARDSETERCGGVQHGERHKLGVVSRHRSGVEILAL